MKVWRKENHERKGKRETLTHGSRCHVLNKTRKEFLALQISIMRFHVISARCGELHGNQLVTLLLEAFDDFTDEAPLDAVRLDHDVWCAR